MPANNAQTTANNLIRCVFMALSSFSWLSLEGHVGLPRLGRFSGYRLEL
jgi:hypothetical protein